MSDSHAYKVVVPFKHYIKLVFFVIYYPSPAMKMWSVEILFAACQGLIWHTNKQCGPGSDCS